jgi:hypothetical protein
MLFQPEPRQGLLAPQSALLQPKGKFRSFKKLM